MTNSDHTTPLVDVFFEIRRTDGTVERCPATKEAGGRYTYMPKEPILVKRGEGIGGMTWRITEPIDETSTDR